MRSRRWPRLVLAVLLAWQLNAGVAIALPHVGSGMQVSGTAPTHCTRDAGAGMDAAGQADDAPAPQCCHHASAGCHCAQLPALTMPTVEVGEAPPPDPPALPRGAPRIDPRGTDFFRPPI